MDGVGEGYEDGDHIVFHYSKMWRPEARKGERWQTWEDLDDKNWIVLAEKKGGKAGEMEVFSRIQEPEVEKDCVSLGLTLARGNQPCRRESPRGDDGIIFILFLFVCLFSWSVLFCSCFFWPPFRPDKSLWTIGGSY